MFCHLRVIPYALSNCVCTYVTCNGDRMRDCGRGPFGDPYLFIFCLGKIFFDSLRWCCGVAFEAAATSGAIHVQLMILIFQVQARNTHSSTKDSNIQYLNILIDGKREKPVLVVGGIAGSQRHEVGVYTPNQRQPCFRYSVIYSRHGIF